MSLARPQLDARRLCGCGSECWWEGAGTPALVVTLLQPPLPTLGMRAIPADFLLAAARRVACRPAAAAKGWFHSCLSGWPCVQPLSRDRTSDLTIFIRALYQLS